MKTTDRLLQCWRIDKAAPYIPTGAKVLDIGSADGALFLRLRQRIGSGSLGIDPTLKQMVKLGGCQLRPGYFPQAVPPESGPFDIITMLAVLEHFPPVAYSELVQGCARFLKPGGRLLITVPSPRVDTILEVMKWLRLVDGMSLEEHHGYRVEQTSGIFPQPWFRLIKRKSFQFGLNNLFVFERTQAAWAA